MQRIHNMVRHILTTQLKDGEIAAATHVARNTVKRYRQIAYEKQYSWDDLAKLKDDELDAKFNSTLRHMTRKRQPDYAVVHNEMKQKGVTRTLLWEEYRAVSPDDALGLSQFTENYRLYLKSIDRCMHQTHQPGHKTFVDFSGLRPKYTNRETGEEVFVEFFVGVLGYSNLTFATCVPTQNVSDWVTVHNRMFSYFGGSTLLLIPDNLKSAVIKPGSDPVINETYLELGRHYSTTIVPARTYHPQDKGSVEVGVQIAQRWILARLRKHNFFSVDEINDAIAELLEILNNKTFKRLSGCRWSKFEEEERNHLQPLPAQRYVFSEWTGLLLVDNSYHVCIKKHWYSVPHMLVGQRVSARLCAGVVEFFHQNQRVTSHVMSTVEGGLTTVPDHQPESHRSYAERSPEKFVAWAKAIGPNLLAVVESQLNRNVPSLGFPACDVLHKLAKTHGTTELESASQRAVEIQSLTVKTIKSLLSTGRHKRARQEKTHSTLPSTHSNVRGGEYYGPNSENSPC